MILKYYGHSFFTLTLENGSVIAFDPYGTLYEYPRRLLRADVCLISHHHYDHDGLSCLEAGAEVIDTPGEHKLACGASVVGVPTFHDGQGGALRGKNTFFIVEAVILPHSNLCFYVKRVGRDPLELTVFV